MRRIQRQVQESGDGGRPPPPREFVAPTLYAAAPPYFHSVRGEIALRGACPSEPLEPK
jgi:hypothetical protein